MILFRICIRGPSPSIQYKFSADIAGPKEPPTPSRGRPLRKHGRRAWQEIWPRHPYPRAVSGRPNTVHSDLGDGRGPMGRCPRDGDGGWHAEERRDGAMLRLLAQGVEVACQSAHAEQSGCRMCDCPPFGRLYCVGAELNAETRIHRRFHRPHAPLYVDTNRARRGGPEARPANPDRGLWEGQRAVAIWTCANQTSVVSGYKAMYKGAGTALMDGSACGRVPGDPRPGPRRRYEAAPFRCQAIIQHILHPRPWRRRAVAFRLLCAGSPLPVYWCDDVGRRRRGVVFSLPVSNTTTHSASYSARPMDGLAISCGKKRKACAASRSPATCSHVTAALLPTPPPIRIRASPASACGLGRRPPSATPIARSTPPGHSTHHPPPTTPTTIPSYSRPVWRSYDRLSPPFCTLHLQITSRHSAGTGGGYSVRRSPHSHGAGSWVLLLFISWPEPGNRPPPDESDTAGWGQHGACDSTPRSGERDASTLPGGLVAGRGAHAFGNAILCEAARKGAVDRGCGDVRRAGCMPCHTAKLQPVHTI
ncbi:hypothetical protein K505DRAFT_344317 [Melanomma pulvis-pyrius CBS 109.77]|uniref:Uncharacterized protein n=1 Tax=Melanomma pulvis-pyrius CBS 109.77 TaxID=1314802 RepID=A0A6A6WPM1_9PLEO|nr:hypothetical protein K505DRAFT_344317 [Melanomma pulvis-pyrius CBS 109.77]